MSPERELVEAVRLGDLSAMRKLIELYQADVYGVCVRILNHRQDAEDVAQEVFLRVFRSIGKWDSTRPFRPWILRIAVNRCRTWMAKVGKRPRTVEFVHEMPDLSPPDGDREVAEAISSVVGGLRDDYREVFILYHETGRSYDEIAEIVDRPVGTVKIWIHRARGIILAQLQERGLVPEAES